LEIYAVYAVCPYELNSEATMTFHLRQALSDEYELCVQLLHDAEEGDDRIRTAMVDSTGATYLAYNGETIVGTAVIHWGGLRGRNRLSRG
jgi:hypothetical protein